MTKLWCIALSFGDTKTGSLVLTNHLAPTAHLAIAQCVSQFYTENLGVRLPLAGMAVLELSREHLETALRAMDEEERKLPSVVPLPRIVGGVMQPTTEADLHPAEREMIRQAIVPSDHLEKRYGMKPIPLSEGPEPADEDDPA